MINFIHLSDNFNSTKDNISRNIFLIRKALGLSHEILCELTGLTRPILSSFENSTGNPTIETLIKISSALNISIEMLFMSRSKFILLNYFLDHLMKFKNNTKLNFYTRSSWKTLLKISGSDEKNTQSKIAKICFEVLRLNYEI